MKRTTLLAALALLVGVATAPAQSAPTDYRDEFLSHFNRSSRKLTMLSTAIPASLNTWSPGEGVMSIGRVYAHIARYNYMYLEESLDIDAPSGVDWPNFESITDKKTIVDLLAKSIEHVQAAVEHMDEERLTRSTMLYGRDVPGWAVLFQLLAHMNEHVGQSIAYARMNNIVPPWSR
jgi:uncharacterized damage-inducible protein DinB